MGKIKKYIQFVNENVETAPVRTKPGVKPSTKPGKPTPIRKPGPGVKPKPKMKKVEDIIDKFNDVASVEDKKEVDAKYEKN